MPFDYNKFRKLNPFLTRGYGDVDEDTPQVGTVAPQVLKRLQDIVSTPQEQPVVNATSEMDVPLTRPLPIIGAAMPNQSVEVNPVHTRPRRALPSIEPSTDYKHIHVNPSGQISGDNATRNPGQFYDNYAVQNPDEVTNKFNPQLTTTDSTLSDVQPNPYLVKNTSLELLRRGFTPQDVVAGAPESIGYEPRRYDPAQPDRAVNETPRNRIVDPVGYQTKVYNDTVMAAPGHPPNALKRFLKSFVRNAPAGGQYGIGGLLGAGLEGGIEGVADKQGYAEAQKGRDVAREGTKLQRLLGVQKEVQGLDTARAQADSTRANTEYTRAIKPALAGSTIAKNAAGIRQGDRRLEIQAARDAVRAKNEGDKLRLSEKSFANLSAFREQLVKKMEREGLQKDKALDLEAQRITEMIRNNNTDNERDRQRTSQGWENAETSRAVALRNSDNAGLINTLDDLADEADSYAEVSTDGVDQRFYRAKAATLREKASRERAKAKQSWPGQGGGQATDNDPLHIR